MGRIPKPTPTVISFEVERILPIDDLKLDFKNNRISHLDVKTEQELMKRLWDEGGLNSLKSDIKARGLQEPLILFPDNNIVAEGNCRLVCLKKLHDEAKQEEKENKIPFEFDSRLKEFLKLDVLCKRIAKNTPESDIDAYLTEIHVGRKKKWPEYNQAKLLYKLKFEDDLTLEEIARISRSSRPTVSKKIEAYKHTTLYHEQFPTDKNFVKKFYYFWEFAHKSLNDFRDEYKNIIKFMKWIHSEKFSNSRQVRDLPKVLTNKKAFKIFEEKNMSEAIKIVMLVDPTIKSPLYRRIYDISNMLRNFPTKEILLILQDNSKKNVLIDLKNTTTKLLKLIEEFEKNEKEAE